jgi:peptide/nickel transport system permease protein
MRRYLLLRLAFAAITLFVAVTAVFLYFDTILPGDDPLRIIGTPVAYDFESSVDLLMDRLGHEKPSLPNRFVTFLGNTVTREFGLSYSFKEPVASVLGPAVRESLVVGAVGVVLAIGLGALVWLVLGAGLSVAAKRAIVFGLGALAAAVALWTVLSAAEALPYDWGSGLYLGWWDATGYGPDGANGVLRAGLLVGVILGGALGVLLWLAVRRLVAARKARQVSGGEAEPVTWRRAWAHALGRRWMVSLAVALVCLAVTVLGERAALLRRSAGVVALDARTAYDYPLVQTALLAAGLFVTLGALALGVIVAALDPGWVASLTLPRRKKVETPVVPDGVAGSAD